MSINEVEYNDLELPVPLVWRPVFEQVVQAFSEGDFRLARGINGVRPVSEEDAGYFAGNVANYGVTLTPLPEAAWEASVYIRYETYWDVLVDLFSVEEGRSDLVLQARAYDRGEGYEFELMSIYVP